MKYLHRVDRARILRREGSVLTCSLVALRQEVEKMDAGQQQRPKVAVGYCSCGAAYPSRVQCGGNHEARRRRQRANRERLRDIRTVSRTLARSLSPFQGGSDSRDPETTGKLQVLRDFSSFSVAAGKSDQSRKDGPVYVGVESHTYRLEDKKAEKGNKNAGEEKSVKKHKNFYRKIEDGLLLVVPTRIYAKEVKALIDSGATRCFVTPSYVAKVGLKGIPRDVFLELGNGEKYLSRGYVPEVPIVTAGLTVKIGLTVTNLLHEVDLVLGINWLQLVNPVVDWGGGKLYVPNAVHTALL